MAHLFSSASSLGIWPFDDDTDMTQGDRVAACEAAGMVTVIDQGQPACVTSERAKEVLAAQNAAAKKPATTSGGGSKVPSLIAPIAPVDGGSDDTLTYVVVGLLLAGGGYLAWRKRHRYG